MALGDTRQALIVRALVNRRRSPIESLLWMAVLLIVPTVLRMMLDNGALGRPFVTYWPTLLIASLALELPYALAYTVIAALLAQRLFGGELWFKEVDGLRLLFFALFVFSGGLTVIIGGMLRQTMQRIAEVNVQQENYNRELRHRVRNMLTLIQALASRGPRATSAMDFYKEFSLRIEGLAAASDLLQIGAEAEGRLPQMVRDTVAPFDRDGRIRLSGEPCLLPAGSCIPLIMALHELCTNAVKYGALSGERGHVELSWFIGPSGSTLYMLWAEKGGPPVTPPTHEGIGMKLLMPQPGLDGAELNFDAAGVWCEIRIEGARALHH
ncbi:HWE histidine kinase domain-containing protein [Novosphingobium jiangmenense]|uniref:histidine kinase n=1 Tax=Novosphingobium jiangmenense TaxID=2791981 RepID=A0ABS0HEN8_9SPHN|nr:sensor histidine kinase [Novosphingobium jiangmenense]